MPSETVRDLLDALYGVVITPRFQRESNTAQLVPGRILKQDPSRIAFIIVNVGANDVGLTPLGQPAPVRSFILAANGGTFSAEWREDGEIVSQEWNAFAVGAPSAVLVVETLIERSYGTKPGAATA